MMESKWLISNSYFENVEFNDDDDDYELTNIVNILSNWKINFLTTFRLSQSGSDVELKILAEKDYDQRWW